MTKVAESMKSGDLEKRVSTKQNTYELQKMAFALNHLSESLEIQQSLRSRLASDLSHELRTPLSVIKSHIEAIRDGIWSLDDTRIDILLRETERLMNLADQVRFIEDVESHQIKLNLQDVELKSWLENIAEYFRPEFKKQNKSFEIIGDPAHINLDADKFKQIIINLMTNALQHTSSGDSITLTIEKIATGVRLNVTDTGAGIAAKDLEHIFERLYRSEEARSRVNGGTGLGLSVVKSLVEAHGFTIIAKSEVGRGTTLTINMIE